MHDIRRSNPTVRPSWSGKPFPVPAPNRPLPKVGYPVPPSPIVQKAKSAFGKQIGIAGFGVVLLVLLGWSAVTLKAILIEHGQNGVQELELSLEAMKKGDFARSDQHLQEAQASFAAGRRIVGPLRPIFLPLRRVPGFSHLVSAGALFQAGEDGTVAVSTLSRVVARVLSQGVFTKTGEGSVIEALRETKKEAEQAHAALVSVKEALDDVDAEVLPEAYRESFLEAREKLPLAVAFLDGYVKHQRLFEELLGADGPRVYLILFQNNHELRATGGFIGSYALLDLHQGHLRRFFVDGIFNPDGQLKENIVPPKPIQKISAGWSLHDSNWFPDFPHSAEKAMFFYEKTGGSTVDGIITLTPNVLERILRITGPITLPEYGVTIDAENFMPIIQEEVEVKFDKEENNPKKILGDLTGALLARFLTFEHPEESWTLGEALGSLLNERHILMYSRHPDIEDLIRSAGWSGEVLSAPHDYLSVIHSNINGYKTDGVMEETIEHQAEIRSDGRIIDTVSITRKHNGGNTAYEWWNKVNADYLRVYVPRGSKLLSAEGMTREFPEAPLDYLALGFRNDADVVREEEGTVIDQASGTRISEDAGKTVFGNWVYVSPGESVTVRYEYELPFRVTLSDLDPEAPTTYSALYQKQAGTPGALLKTSFRYPDSLKPVWQTPENLIPYERVYSAERRLVTDFFWGAVLKPDKL